MNFGLILVIFGIAGTVAYLAYLADKRRTDALKAVATRLGAAPLDSIRLPAESLTGLQLWNRGRSRSRRHYNVLCFQRVGKREFLFDYRYTSGSGKHKHTHTLSVFLVEVPGLPSFELRPEGFLDRIGEVVGFKDIDFQANPDFSKKYSLKGNDEAAIRGVFTPNVIHVCLRCKDISAESANGFFVVYRNRKLVAPDQIEAFLRECREVSESVKGK